MPPPSFARKTTRRIISIAACLLGAILALISVPSAFAAFGLTTATDSYTIDAGATPSLVFKIRRTETGSTTSIGDIMSLVYNGVEYQDLSRGSQVNSGFDYLYTGVSAVSLTAEVVNTDYIKVTVVGGNLTHYYLVHKGEARIYMATYFTTEPDTLGLCRYIMRMQSAVLPNGPTPSDIRNTDSTIESADIFAFSSTNTNTALIGQTRSKHYSNMRLKDWSYIGATGTNVGIWMVRDNQEGGSGGPFYRSLLNQCGSDQEITYIVNYGEGQTEAFRPNILNSYTLVLTTGAAPGAVDTSWFSGMGLTGYVAATGRGSVTGAGITNRDASYTYTVGFANSTAQYFTTASASDGSFTMAGMLPGDYTVKVYKNELTVATTSVSVTAGASTPLAAIALTADPSSTVPLWRIGNWDGTPGEFVNGDKLTYMHPSDVRMSSWAPGPYVIGTSNPATGMPAYQWKDIGGGSQTIQFNLTSGQIASSTVKVGITCAYAGARPNIAVNSWTAALQSSSTQPSSRTLTVGTYRGNNVTYTFSVPASALVVGTNNLYLYPISGQTGTGYLSPGYSLDCVELYQGTAQTLAVPAPPASVTASGGDTQVALSWSTVSGATSYIVLRASVGGGPYTLIASGIASTSFTDTGLTNGTTYYYVVSATNSSGTGLQSGEVAAQPVPPTPPAAPTGLSATAYNASASLTWNTSFTATSYKVKRSTTSGSGYVTMKTVTTQSYSDFGLVNGTTYYYVVSAVSASGESANSSEVSVTPSAVITATFTSLAAQDGYIMGASGNTAGSTISSTGWIRIGDTNANRQYEGIFSFDTSSIPSSATIVSATLKMKRAGLTGANPFTILGTCYADIKTGSGFNGNTALETADFQAPADATQVATMSNASSNNTWSTGALNSTGLGWLVKTAPAQFRVYFATATNNNSAYDYISWYAGDDTIAANRPVLEVTYSTGPSPSSLPVAYLPFNETSGATAADATGYGWTGTLVNSPTWATGKVNNAVSLSGTNQYVSLPAGVVSSLGDFTIAAWVNLNSVTYWSRIFDFGTGSTNYMFLTPSNGATSKLRFAIRTSSVAEQVIEGTGPLPIGAWTHVSVSLSGSTGTLYVNGAAVGTNSAMTLKPSSLGSTTLNHIGRSQFSADPYLNGLVDEFQIYNHALTASEVALLAAPPAAPANLAAVVGDSQAALSWSAVSGTVTGYNVKRATASAGPYTTIASGVTSTSYKDLSLVNGTTYFYTVSALNGVAEGSNTLPVAATPLANSTGVAATSFNGSVSLSWSAATGATSYNVKRSTVSGGPYTTISNGVTATSYSDTTASAGTTYYYVVSSVNSTGESANSAQITIVASPTAPAGLAALPGNAVVAISWNASAGAATYNVLRSQTNGTGYSELATGLSATSYNDTSAVNGVTYYYVVSAANTGGESAWSAQTSATPVITNPAVRLRFDESSGTTASDSSGNGKNGTLVNGPLWVTGANAKINNAVSLDGTNDHVTLPTGVVSSLNDFTVSAWVNLSSVANWSRIFDFGTGTTNYMFLTPTNSLTGKVRFAIRTAAVAEQLIEGAGPLTTGWMHIAVTLSGSTGTLYVNGQLAGTNTSMTLKPSTLGSTTLNYIGKSQFTADPYLNGVVDEFQIYNRALLPVEVATLAATPPAAPGGLAATATTGQVTLSWNAVDGVTSYSVLRATTSGGPYTSVTTAVTDTTYTHTGLTNGTLYYYVVTSVKSVAESANSSQVSATPLAVPTGFSATAGNGQVSLSWTAVSGATSYNIKRSLTSGGGYTGLATSGTTNITDSSLTNGTTYYYVISAVNMTGESGDSAQASARPTAPISAQEQQSPSIVMSGGNAYITVNASVIGHTYQLQYRDDLGTGTWLNYGSAVQGSGGAIQFTPSVDPSVPRRFYRILIQP